MAPLWGCLAIRGASFDCHDCGGVLGSSQSPPILKISQEDPQDSVCRHTPMAMIYYSKGCKAQSAKAKGIWDKVWGKSGGSFQGFPHSGVAEYVSNYPNSKLRWHLQNAVCQGSSLETPCPRFLLRADHRGNLCLA